MTDSDRLRALQGFLDAYDVGAVLVPEATAAKLAPALRQLADQLRRNGGHIAADVGKALSDFEAAKRRRDERAQVPKPEPVSVPKPEPEGSSTEAETRGLSTTEAAECAGVEPRTITKAISEGRLPATRVGGRWLLSQQDVDEYARSR